MKSILEHPLYIEDLEKVAKKQLPWEKLQNSSIFVSGATGFVGSFLVDVIMHLNRTRTLNCKVYALGRNEAKAKERFDYAANDKLFEFVSYDVNRPIVWNGTGEIGYVLHLASNTHPRIYATDPIGTITTNIIGTQNMLEFAHTHHALRSLFVSSNEVYGENRGDVELFDEAYCGYIDCNTLRAGYPESKRCGEALCQAYIHQREIDLVIPRLTRSYGPTLQKDDSKAISQFFHKAFAGEDIVLKSKGTQYYSYTYVADAVSGLLYVLLLGEKGEAYNISDEASDIQLKDLAETIANKVGKKVIYEIPDAIEAAGFSKATKARLDNKKIKALGWKALYDIQSGIERTIEILKCY